MSDSISMHLTRPNPKLAEYVSRTPAGMAYWAGTGPKNSTCRECTFFDHAKRYYAKRGMNGGSLKPARCTKYSALCSQAGGLIPHATPACKYFEAATAAPPITEK